MEPTLSARATTSWEHSGCTMICTPGCSARAAATCSGVNRWCTEQWPFQRRKRESLISRSSRPPSSKRGFQTFISVGRVAHGEGGVAAQVLVGHEQHPVAPLQGPGQDAPGVGRGAAGAAVAADEGLHRRRGVDVGDGHDPLDVDDAGQGLPALLDLVDVGHVGHRTAGVQVGEDDPLVGAGEDVGRLGHEVDAAEHDVGRPSAFSAA